jgi:hypothetical protein
MTNVGGYVPREKFLFLNEWPLKIRLISYTKIHCMVQIGPKHIIWCKRRCNPTIKKLVCMFCLLNGMLRTPKTLQPSLCSWYCWNALDEYRCMEWFCDASTYSTKVIECRTILSLSSKTTANVPFPTNCEYFLKSCFTTLLFLQRSQRICRRSIHSWKKFIAFWKFLAFSFSLRPFVCNRCRLEPKTLTMNAGSRQTQ